MKFDQGDDFDILIILMNYYLKYLVLYLLQFLDNTMHLLLQCFLTRVQWDLDIIGVADESGSRILVTHIIF